MSWSLAHSFASCYFCDAISFGVGGMESIIDVGIGALNFVINAVANMVVGSRLGFCGRKSDRPVQPI